MSPNLAHPPADVEPDVRRTVRYQTGWSQTQALEWALNADNAAGLFDTPFDLLMWMAWTPGHGYTLAELAASPAVGHDTADAAESIVALLEADAVTAVYLDDEADR